MQDNPPWMPVTFAGHLVVCNQQSRCLIPLTLAPDPSDPSAEDLIILTT